MCDGAACYTSQGTLHVDILENHSQGTELYFCVGGFWTRARGRKDTSMPTVHYTLVCAEAAVCAQGMAEGCNSSTSSIAP